MINFYHFFSWSLNSDICLCVLLKAYKKISLWMKYETAWKCYESTLHKVILLPKLGFYMTQKYKKREKTFQSKKQKAILK